MVNSNIYIMDDMAFLVYWLVPEPLQVVCATAGFGSWGRAYEIHTDPCNGQDFDHTYYFFHFYFICSMPAIVQNSEKFNSQLKSSSTATTKKSTSCTESFHQLEITHDPTRRSILITIEPPASLLPPQDLTILPQFENHVRTEHQR